MGRREKDRWLVNLALFGVVIILLAILLIDGSDSSGNKATIGDFLPDEIARIQIIRPGKQAIEFARQSDYWEILAPIQARADDAVMQRVLSITGLEIASQIKLDHPKNETTLEDFGLQPSQANLIVNDTRIDFGSLQPVNELRYLLIDDNIYLVPDQHMSQLNAGSVSYVDRHLTPGGNIIREIRINGEPVQLTDNLRTQWQLIKANWISHVDAEAPSEKGVTVQIELQNQDTAIEYLAIKRETALVLIRNGLEYHLGHNAIDMLGLPFGSP